MPSDVARILEHHVEGLQRVATVIQGNAGYDSLMEHKLTTGDRERFSVDVELAEKRVRAASLCARELRARRHKLMLPEFSGFACDGNTKNNLREFEFFQRICSPFADGLVGQNYSTLPRISAGRLTAEQPAALEKIISDLEEFYRTGDRITASLVHQHVLYSHSFFSFLLSFSATGAIKPAALVLANDHSPVRVALSMVAKGMSVPRIYLQHAEVTHSFPPLDFEYSVLRNEKSLATYREIGAIRGRAYIIPRYEEPFQSERLARSREVPQTVVVYPTSRLNMEPLKSLVRVLAGNSAVKKIIIKEHPGAIGGLADLSSAANVSFSTTVPEEDHVAIVGNSSMAVELLHQGIPVYQNFDFDPVSRDYYGLVRSGVTYEIGMADAAQIFWKRYDTNKQWLEAYSAWDATAGGQYLHDRANFVSEMSKLRPMSSPNAKRRRRPMRGRLRAQAKGSLRRNLVKAANAFPNLSSLVATWVLMGGKRISDRIAVNTDRIGRFLTANTEIRISAPVWRHSGKPLSRTSAARDDQKLLRFLFRTLVQLDDPADWLLENEKLEAVPASQVIAALELAFHERDSALSKVFQGIQDGSDGSAVGCWIYLKKVEWGNFPLAQREIDEIAQTIYAYEGELGVKDLLEQALLGAILRSGSCEQLDVLWQRASVLKWSALSVPWKMQVLRKLQSDISRITEAEGLLREIEEQASPFELLKLENTQFLEGRGRAGWDHAYAEQKFLKVAPPDLRREFLEKVSSAFDALRPRMHFMNVRNDKDEIARLLALIADALQTRQPFSLIRLSDGEGYLFPEGAHFSSDDRSNRERHWWGQELPAVLREKIIHHARKAIAEADLVGIPTVFRFIRDHGEGSLSLARSVQGRGLLEVLAGTPKLASAAMLTEDKVNVALFSDPEELARFLPLARRVVLVSSVQRHALPDALQQQTKLKVVPLPTHHKTALNEKYHTGPQPLPFVYEAILEQLDQTIEPGDLVLVAGGIVGKIFTGRARERGAVALDLGHVIDDWISPNLASLR